MVVRNKRNLHVSGSRNEGLKVAHGEYIGFSDHDDYRDLRMYELLYEKAKSEKADMVVSDVRVIHEDRREEICRFNDPSRSGLVNSVLLPMEDSNNRNQLSKSVWHSVYSRAFLTEKGIAFEDRRTYFEEDTLFNLKAVLCARSIAHVKEVLYVWDKRPDSLSNEWATMIPQKQMKSFDRMADLLKDSNDFEQYKDSLWTLVSNEVNRYYPMYKGLEGNDKASFHDLLKKIDFPLFGRYNLKLVSKKRLKLFFFLFKAKYT